MSFGSPAKSSNASTPRPRTRSQSGLEDPRYFSDRPAFSIASGDFGDGIDPSSNFVQGRLHTYLFLKFNFEF